MLRLLLAATSHAGPLATVVGSSSAPAVRANISTRAMRPLMVASSSSVVTLCASSRFFATASISSVGVSQPLAAPRRFYSSAGPFGGYFRSVSGASTLAAQVPFGVSKRFVQVRGKGAAGGDGGEPQTDEKQDHAKDNTEGDEQKKTESEESESESSSKKHKGKGKKSAPPRKTLRDHFADLKNDYKTFDAIYNSPNFINFLIFTLFCLCSAGSNNEERFWKSYFALNNEGNFFSNVLLNFTFHSFLTDNFLSMTFAMMLVHTLCHALLPTMGSRNLLIFVGATAFCSGAVVYAWNLFYHSTLLKRNKKLIAEGKEASEVRLEKQYGPWDVVHALFLMHYSVFGIGPVAVLNSFSSWLKYACWVGEICILYFDWQPTVAGTIVGFALLRHPLFKQYVKFPQAASKTA